jgi:hypothetical protein
MQRQEGISGQHAVFSSVISTGDLLADPLAAVSADLFH